MDSAEGVVTDLRLVRGAGVPPRARQPLLPNAVLATLMFVFTEIMLFSGFISAHTIAAATVPPGMWPPPGQPRLPIETTGFNSVVLLASGVLIYWAGRKFAEGPSRARIPFAVSLALGTFFVLFQGWEWQGLLVEGMTLTTSAYSAFFYLIVGTHALHAIGGLGAMAWTYLRLVRGTLEGDELWAMQCFWYFVVGLWPVLYWLVYL